VDGVGYVRKSTLKVRAVVEHSSWLWLATIQNVTAGFWYVAVL
jgi:hypothetical protein